jgi:yecA family protein
MSASNWTFKNLLQACAKHPNALNPVSLHGFLTAIAIGPDEVEDKPILPTVYGFTTIDPVENYSELGELVWEAVGEIAMDLIDNSFEALLHRDTDSPEDPALWMEGFNKAVTLNEKGWEALNEEHPEAVKKFVFIQSFTGPDTANSALGIPTETYVAYLTEALPLFSQALSTLYISYWGDLAEDIPIDLTEGTTNITLDDLPTFSPEELQQQTDEELLFNILSHGDMLPREVVDEAIRRGQSIAGLLRRHLEDPDNWGEDVEPDDWWGLLHAIFILGYISGEDATQGLLQCIKAMHTNPHDNLWDWIGGYWPTLFKNKRELARESLQQIAYDRELYWYARITALDCLVEAAEAAGDEALNRMLEKVARIADDEDEEWEFRPISAMLLLNFPRDEHRGVLEKLAKRQEELEDIPHFNTDDVKLTYDLREEEPEWKRFTDPLKFYDPENILRRQIRWAEEDELPMDDDSLFEDSDDLSFLDEPPPPTTYVREIPKVGRNDPCPCGSGKKYKKCCLKKLH